MKYLITILITVFMLSAHQSIGQDKWITRNGKITFFSKTAVENIEATNNQVFSLIDPAKNEIAFQVLITGFQFEKALMQEHFNENYMESSKYPKATFKGIIADPSKIDFTKEGVYYIMVDGNLTIHGVTNKISVPATITIAGKKITGNTKFSVKVADYNIKIPSLVATQVSETIEISVNGVYEIFMR